MAPPCGGIYPTDYKQKRADDCFSCGKLSDSPMSFVEEWDAFIHDSCIDMFLTGPEGEIVLSHGHEIERRK